MRFLAAILPALRQTLRRARQLHLNRLAASIAFYALFSLPALLVAAIQVAGIAYGESEARGKLVAQVAQHLGDGLAASVDSVIASAAAAGATKTGPRILALLALFFGASLTFAALQHALNVIWGSACARRWYVAVALKRLLSFSMVLLTGVLLIAAMAASVGLARFGTWLAEYLPPDIAVSALRWIDPLVSLVLLAGLFGLLFKVLPDGRVPWKRAGVGALVTASLLVVARMFVARYLGMVDVGSAYGAAGSLLVLLVWIYASCMVVLLGGAFAVAWEQVRSAQRASVPPEVAATIG